MEMESEMSEPVFSAEDFKHLQGYYDMEFLEKVVIRANAKIEKLLGPEVFGNEHGYWGVESDDENRDMYTARLFNVQPIEKKPCEHQPSSNTTTLVSNGEMIFVCKYCRETLSPIGWMVKK